MTGLEVALAAAMALSMAERAELVRRIHTHDAAVDGALPGRRSAIGRPLTNNERTKLKRARDRGATADELAALRASFGTVADATKCNETRNADATLGETKPATEVQRNPQRDATKCNEMPPSRDTLARAVSDLDTKNPPVVSAGSSPSSQQPLDLGEAKRNATKPATARATKREPGTFTTQVFVAWAAGYSEHTGVQAPVQTAAAMAGAKTIADWIEGQAAREQRDRATVLADWLRRLFASGDAWHGQRFDYQLHKVCGDVAKIYRLADRGTGALSTAPRPGESFDDARQRQQREADALFGGTGT